MRRIFVVVLMVIGLPLSSLLIVAGPAFGQVAPSIAATSVILVEKGVAADVQLIVTCEVGSNQLISLAVMQRAGRQVTEAQYYGSGNFQCTGAPQQVAVRAFVAPGLPALKPGRALVQGAMQDFVANTTATFSETLKLTTK